ncbi:MAG TPA: 16S rRNA (cytosine(967)-C(5))-methyltransferase RsmB [Limnochordia bacterium]|nr:16S rRNA (cytosine(967)-C(5))-methyltransferase RsmB [Limnochordia bacterium]
MRERWSNPRYVAVDTLNKLAESDEFLKEVVDRQIARATLSRLDQGLYTELVFGTVRMRRNLDYVLAQFSSRPVEKIQPALLNVLRIGVYQLLYLDRIPPSAAVNESVKLARAFGHEGTAKFANGVLRQVLRGRDSIAYPALEKDSVGHVGLKYSFPAWIVEHWLQRWGPEETVSLCRAMNEPPQLHIRVNTLKGSVEEVRTHLEAQGVTVQKGRYLPEVLAVHPAHLVVADAWLAEGRYYIQDESSALAAHALQVQPGQIVYDLCSAPGGKATHLAQLMGNKGEIVAFDVHPQRLALVEENARRLGISIIRPRLGDATGDLQLIPAPRVLVDAPCSGLGTMRHRPDIRWKKTPGEVAELVAVQKAILRRAAQYVAPGGLLLYSTCTLTEWENEEVAQWFLAEHQEFTGQPFLQGFPGWGAQPWLRTLLPHRHGVDGFFLALFRKEEV